MLCKRLLDPPLSLCEQKNDMNFTLRLSFSRRILKFLRDLVKEVPYGACDVDLLHSVTRYADKLPTLFKLKFDFRNGNLGYKESKYGDLLLEMFEEFLQFGKIVFYDSTIFRNIQACMIASMMGILGSEVWRYDRSSSSPSPPLIYSPQVVLCLLKFLKDAKSWASPTHDMKINLDVGFTDHSCESEASGPSCHVRDEKILLLRRHTFEELLNIIFPQSEKWMDNLVHLMSFLHSEGVKSTLIEKSRLSSTKPVVASDLEIVAIHEEEAIFGNLFSEPTKPVGSADGHDQPTAAVTSTVNSDLSLQAVSELLSFMKACIFSPEWCCSVFEDACRKVDKNHIDQLLSLLDCYSYLSDGRNENSPVLGSHLNVPYVSGICFELLQNLVVCHALSSPLKEHLVDQVLKVEDGNYVYGQHSLILLAHALILQEDLDHGHIIKKIYEGYFTQKNRYTSIGLQCKAFILVGFNSFKAPFNIVPHNIVSIYLPVVVAIQVEI
ncbi:hypothetical protein B296_00014536 [Ensete ventricosum]|uniref:Uncharacterized protein n=1 Tax=Ensete ventricosum TaxID=4639 RepID=A0A427B1H4_ENSVE|nr:hypothetical protein B296_00014536 [Ensete ventricosum]